MTSLESVLRPSRPPGTRASWLDRRWKLENQRRVVSSHSLNEGTWQLFIGCRGLFEKAHFWAGGAVFGKGWGWRLTSGWVTPQQRKVPVTGTQRHEPQEEHNKNRAPGQLRAPCFHSPVLLERALPLLRRLTPQTLHVQGPTGKGQSLLLPLVSGPWEPLVHLRSNSMSKTTVTPGPRPTCEKLNLF